MNWVMASLLPKQYGRWAARPSHAFGCLFMSTPEPPSAMSAEKSAGVRDGVEALAFGGTETSSNRAGDEQSGVQAALNLPGS